MISSYTVIPREGHLDHVEMFSFLKTHHNSRLVLDPTHPNIILDDFKCDHWKKIHGDVKELIPLNSPRLIDKEFFIRVVVDADFVGDSLIIRLRSGFMVMLKNTTMFWFFKKQFSMEISSFGSEFVAIQQCCQI